MSVDIPSVELSSGFRLPLVGLGTYDMLGMPCVDAVSDALRSGYRLLDTASRYSNELSVGMGLRESGIARDEVAVQTKLGGGDQAGSARGLHRGRDRRSIRVTQARHAPRPVGQAPALLQAGAASSSGPSSGP